MDDAGPVAIGSLSEQQTIRDKRVHPNGILKLFPQEEVQQSMPIRSKRWFASMASAMLLELTNMRLPMTS